MRARLVLMATALMCCLAIGAGAQRVPRPGTRPDDRPVFAVPSDEKTGEVPREMEAASTLNAAKQLKVAVGAVDTTAVDAAKAAKATDDAETHGTPIVVAGRAPVVVLVAGAAAIGVVALTFQTRRSGKKERDASDPMQQSLLYHDMDYAAM